MGTKQALRCMVCGLAMEVDFDKPGYEPQGLCGRECSRELNWRKALCLTDSPYRPDPTTSKNPPVPQASGELRGHYVNGEFWGQDYVPGLADSLPWED
jgi:hypothetical protein